MRVLIVDDEVRLAHTLGRGLAADGAVVELAHDGPAGLEAATSGEFDVIVLDIMLPGLSGYQVLRQLREREIWTPILMLSAKDGDYDQSDALDLGADDYLTKPFSYVVLIAHLRALIRRGAPERPAVLTVGSLSLDPGRRKVIRGDVEISLTPREFNVLLYLMRNKNSAVTKHNILTAVWDMNYEGDGNIVEVYIGYLRRKIDVPFGTSTIETVRGVGYTVADEAKV
ncbi:response regulator transcription factor [Smaragdicoccus niigatensis]|uniref:response regulator transcription factor n=1 Tax=Smaragdicoccus niigatensis TaxID=359359 RepID=UPI00036CEC55|nr:response regulator transcription factor [Smaragdicoccus niigatensis]